MHSNIHKTIFEFGSKINAPEYLLSLPSSPLHESGDHLEIRSKEYHLVSTNRGYELKRKKTRDLNELLYWFFDGVTFSLACQYELKNRIDGEDPRRQIFSKQLELLGILDENWRKKSQIKISKTLEKHPYADG
jgi:immunity protein 63 of polymorphic toxin system